MALQQVVHGSLPGRNSFAVYVDEYQDTGASEGMVTKWNRTSSGTIFGTFTMLKAKWESESHPVIGITIGHDIMRLISFIAMPCKSVEEMRKGMYVAKGEECSFNFGAVAKAVAVRRMAHRA